MNELGRSWVNLDLLSQSIDVLLDQIGFANSFGSPDLGQDGVSADHFARVADQQAYHLELFGAEVDASVADYQLVSAAVEDN
jgi:hypothetical protein